MRKIFLFVLIFSPLLTIGDENIAWRDLMIISPGYLGPNAIPVPEMKTGLLSKEKRIEFGSDFHFMKGDHTQDISGCFYWPFADGKIAIELSGVIIERYTVSDSIISERNARDTDRHGSAFGDLYFATMIQLFRNRKFPDTMLRMCCKTASGTHLEAARYSDTPGYFFDLNFSKKLGAGKFIPYGMLGFYSWQTTDDVNMQDDAFMYGGGLNIHVGELSISNSLSGYYGYKKDKDQPLVYTFDIQKRIKNYTARIRYLHGLHDWMYRTIKISLIWNFK